MDGKLAKLPGLKDDDRRRSIERCSWSDSSGEMLCLTGFGTGAGRGQPLRLDDGCGSGRDDLRGRIGQPPAKYYQDVRTSLVKRFRRDPYLSEENAEFFADKCITDWLEQCPVGLRGVCMSPVQSRLTTPW